MEGRKSCEDICSTTELSNRSGDVPQICKTSARSGRRRRNRRSPGCVFERLVCPGGSVAPWFTASYCRDGSLAVIQSLWVQQTAEESSMFDGVATAHTCAHSTSNACMRPSELLTLRKKDLVPPLVLLPCWSIVIAASEPGVSTKTGIAEGAVLVGQRWLQWVNKPLPALKAGTPEENLEFRLPCSSKHVQDCKQALWDSAE